MYMLMMSIMCAASAAAWMWAENNGIYNEGGVPVYGTSLFGYLAESV